MQVRQVELARQLGLSSSTVSRALASDPRISKATRERVVEAARSLGYSPNLLAASFRTGSTMTIGLIVVDIANPFYSEIGRGVEDNAYDQGYSVVLCNSDGDPEKEARYVEMLHNRKVDGILLTPMCKDAGVLQRLANRDVPYVLIDAADVPDNVSAVTVDHVKGAYLAVRHLLECGHTRIGFVGGKLEIPPVQMMFQGYKKAMSAAGIKYESEWVLQETLAPQGGYAAVGKILQMENRPTAAVFVSDLTAIAAMKAVQERGLLAPRDLAIIGYDDIPMAAVVNPPLTTVAQNKHELGRISARILIHEIRTGTNCLHQHTMLQPKLIIRNSCCPASTHVPGALPDTLRSQAAQ